MKTIALITTLVTTNVTHDSIFIKDESLAKEFIYIWDNYPVKDTNVVKPYIIVIKQ